MNLDNVDFLYLENRSSVLKNTSSTLFFLMLKTHAYTHAHRHALRHAKNARTRAHTRTHTLVFLDL